jgi:hypothetical protein
VRRCNWAAAVLVLSTACGGARTLTNVGMQKDQTDIVYGFNAKAVPSAAAPQAPAAAVQSAGDGIGAPAPAPFPPGLFASNEASSGPCPSAPPGASVSGAAATDVRGHPQPGKYRWIASGSYELSGTKVPVPKYTFAYVTPSQKYNATVQGSPDDFAYTTITPEVAGQGSYRRFAWATKPNPQSANDPEGGLVLKRVEYLGGDAKVAAEYFTASGDGLLMMPFPVKPGQSWNSLSVDTSRQKILRLSAQVLRRETVDACGTLVQGWRVHGTLNDAASTATLDYLVAPQYGGLIISLKADGMFVGVTMHGYSTHTGQLKPDPLPDRFK